MLFYLVSAIIVAFYFCYPRTRWENAVTLYVAVIPLLGLLGPNDQLLGFLDHRSVVSALVIFSVYVLHPAPVAIRNSKQDGMKYSAIFLYVFMILVLERYIEIKNGLIFDNLDMVTQLKRLMRDSIYTFALVMVVYRMYDIRTLQGLKNGLLIGIGIIVSSMLFYDFYLQLGFSLQGETIYLREGDDSRLTGFMLENANNAAAIFNSVVAYVLARNETVKNFTRQDIVLFMLCLIGIFLCASRTGIIVLVFICMLYSVRKFKNIKSFITNLLVMALVGIIMYNHFGGLAAERFHQYQTGEEDTLATRQSYWKLYANDLIENPDYLFIGNLEPPTYDRDVHNVYFYYLFRTGLVPFLVMVFHFWKIYKLRNYYQRYSFYYTPVYALFALLISWITGAGFIYEWFVLVISASSGVPEPYCHQQAGLPNDREASCAVQ